MIVNLPDTCCPRCGQGKEGASWVWCLACVVEVANGGGRAPSRSTKASNSLPCLLGWVRKNEGVLGLAAVLWVTVWWVGCR